MPVLTPKFFYQLGSLMMSYVVKDHESPELLAHVFFGGKKPEKRSFLQNPNRW